MHACVITYDICDARRLRRVARLLESEGVRIQKSVFECGGSFDHLTRLRAAIRNAIESAEDKVLYQPLCPQCREGTLFQGLPAPMAAEPFWIV